MSDEFVEVRFTAAGVPWRIRRGGRLWQVAVEPGRHFERVNWWEDHSFRIKKGAADPIDFAVWRVQVRLGSNPRSDLVERPRNGSWTVRDVA